MWNVKIEYNEMKYLFDSRLSLKAKGCMATMVAYVNKNNTKPLFLINEIREMNVDGKAAFGNALNELIDYGYVVRERAFNGFKGTPWFFTLKE